MNTPPFDPGAICTHLEMLHGLAAAAGVDGYLALAGYGEDPHTGTKARERHEHFRIGDVDGMTRSVLAYQHLPNLNAYAPWAIVRKDIGAGKRGGERDVLVVLAFVADLDADTGKAGELPLSSPYEIETSPGNLQAVYPLSRALAPAEAKPLAEGLADAAGCDSRTKDLSGVWRIPGALNWPNRKKAGRGRDLTPCLVRVASSWNGDLVNPDDLRTAIAAHSPPRRERKADPGTDGNARSLKELLRRCGAGIRKNLVAPPLPDEDRSETAGSVISSLINRQFSDAEILALIEAHPDGLGSRYVFEGKDLEADIARLRRKYGKPDDGEVPTIRVVAGELPRVVNEAEAALIGSGLPIFSRAGSLVRPILDTIPAAHGRTTTVAKFKELCPDTAVDLLSRVATFERFDRRSDEWVTIDPPA